MMSSPFGTLVSKFPHLVVSFATEQRLSKPQIMPLWLLGLLESWARPPAALSENRGLYVGLNCEEVGQGSVGPWGRHTVRNIRIL